jgi:ABC-2 type transport system ATP-binding protein
VVGFLGPNGAGKTTTLRMLTGYVAPDEGSIRIDGVDAVLNSREARKRIGYMPETVPLYGELRVDEYLKYRARLKGVPRGRVAERVGASMEMASIADVRFRIIGQLSRGYRSRVGLADALVADPPLLVLDEPTAGLDPNQIRQVRRLIRDMAGKKTVLLSTHILPEVESTCERVVIIHQGRLVGEGVPGDLRTRERGSQLILLEVRGDPARVGAVLESVSGIRRLVDLDRFGENADPPLLRVRLESDPDPAILERVFEAVAGAGFKLREMRRERASLEDVFASLTTEEAGVTQTEPDADEDADGAETGEAG